MFQSLIGRLGAHTGWLSAWVFYCTSELASRGIDLLAACVYAVSQICVLRGAVMAKARVRRREVTGDKTVSVHVRMSPELAAVLHRVADAEGIAVGTLVRRMVYSYIVPMARLKSVEDLLDAGAPSEALQEFSALLGYKDSDVAKVLWLLSRLGGADEKDS